MSLRHHRAPVVCLLLLTAAVLLLIVLPHPPASPVDGPASAHRAAASLRALPPAEQPPGHPPVQHTERQSSSDRFPAEPLALTHRGGGTHSVSATSRAPLGADVPSPAVAPPAPHQTRAAGTRRPGPAALSPAVLQTFRC